MSVHSTAWLQRADECGVRIRQQFSSPAVTWMNCEHLAEALQSADRIVELLSVDELDPSLVTDSASVTYAFTKSTYLDLNFLWSPEPVTKLVSLIQGTAVTLWRLDLCGAIDSEIFFSSSLRETVVFTCLKKLHLAGELPIRVRSLIRLLSHQTNLTYVHINGIELEEPDFDWATNISSALPPSCTSWSICYVSVLMSHEALVGGSRNKLVFPADGYREGNVPDDVPDDAPQIKGWRAKYHMAITKRGTRRMSVQFYRVKEE